MASRVRSLSPPHEVKPIILGVFGMHNKITEKTLILNILHPIVEELGRLPDKVLVPYEGSTSMFIQSWCDVRKVPYQVISADWKRNHKTAGIMRDARIQSECSHALVFLGQKSTRYEKYAEKMAITKRDPKIVFTVSYQDYDLELLEPSQSYPQEEPAHKSSSGKEPQSLLGQTQLSFGSQTLS